MSRVFFTSDLHFGHKGLIECLRHMSPEESDELIIDNWNSIVSKHDKVYVLGDITMEKPANLDVLNRLKGDIAIIGGNHDTQKCCKAISALNIPVLGVLSYKGFLCTHIPIHPLFLKECRGNIHGHIHIPDTEHNYNMTLPQGSDRYFNVNCEFHDYKPVPFETIENYFISLATNE